MGYSPWDRKESDTTEATWHIVCVVNGILRVVVVFFFFLSLMKHSGLLDFF